jgi:exosortase
VDNSRQSTNGILEDFRIDFQECWRQLPNKGFFLILVAAWLALFQFVGNSTLGYVHSPSLFRWVMDAYHPRLADWLRSFDVDAISHWMGEADEGVGVIAPMAVLGLYWWKRKQLMALPLRAWSPGVAVVALALVMHIFAYLIQQPKLSLVAFFVGLYGLTGMAWGPAWLRGSLFPFFLFAFCIPLGLLAQPITFNLRLLVCRLVEFIGNYILAIDIKRDGTSLTNAASHYGYDVAAACSGMRSLTATLGLAVVFAFISYRTWWKRGLLIASAFPLAVLGNLLRMMAIVIAAEIGGQPWGDYVHEGGPLGLISLIPYIPAFLGLLWLGHLIQDRPPKPASEEKTT